MKEVVTTTSALPTRARLFLGSMAGEPQSYGCRRVAYVLIFGMARGRIRDPPPDTSPPPSGPLRAANL